MNIETRIKILQSHIEAIPEKNHYNLIRALEEIVEILKALDE